ncbi:MAG TPA: redoxin domain-containing protein [Thermoanaerobaculia bacterium]|nr:redoxin domain-containing protein [Thermoanaerobaculia bacterium]
MDTKNLARGAFFLLLVFVAAFGGVWAGMKFRESRAPASSAVAASNLQPGAELPDRAVVAPDGASHSTRELVAGGAVVMFLDLDCEPCGHMVTRWQEAIDEGELTGVDILGITTDAGERVPGYRSDKGLSFPIYVDPAGALFQDAEVTSVPLVVFVGPDGQVTGNRSDYRLAIEGDAIRDLVAGTA